MGQRKQTRGNAKSVASLLSAAHVPQAEQVSQLCPCRPPEVVSVVLFSRFVGQKLQEEEEPPNMASEVCRTGGTLQRSGEEPVCLNRVWGHLLPHRPEVILKFPTSLPKTGFT